MPPRDRKRRTRLKRLKNLLNKEARLAASPLSWLFLLFSAATLLPGYPLLLGAMFICLGIFYSFHAVAENHDLLYTVLLPIPKRDAVTGKYLFSCCVQALGFALTAVFAAVRMSGPGPAGGGALMGANVTYLGFVPLVFAAFNLLFVEGFFHSGGKLGRPFLGFVGAGAALMALEEVLHRLPGLSFLGATSGRALLFQLPVLVIGLGLWVYGTLRSLRRAQTLFVKADL